MREGEEIFEGVILLVGKRVDAAVGEVERAGGLRKCAERGDVPLASTGEGQRGAGDCSAEGSAEEQDEEEEEDEEGRGDNAPPVFGRGGGGGE